jgi:uncharacterized protein with FMN-binding domain
MEKSSLALLALTLAILGAAVTAGYPAWGTMTGVAILLLAGGIAVGAVPTRSEGYTLERRAEGQKISNSLVTLSSAAILAVYTAGYYRTRSAADEFEAQAVRRKTAAPIAATSPGAEATPTVPGSPAPPLRKNRPRPSPTVVPKAAPAPIERSQATPSASPAATRRIQYKDGTYLGLGTSRHGDIQASVVIEDGKIVSALITQCLTRYSCTWIAPRTPPGYPDLPGQVVERQSPKVDYVSGATESSDAYSDAVSEALSKASE